MNIEASIKAYLEDSLAAIEISIDSVEYVKESGNMMLKIVIDAPYVIDLDKCVEATHIINDILDKEDPISDSYILDVSSKEKGGN